MRKKILLCLFIILSRLAFAQTDIINIIPSGNVGISSTAPVSGLEVNSSYGQKVTTITAATTLTDDENTVVCNNGATAIAVTLPAANTATGRVYVIKKNSASTGIVTLTGTIDGATNLLLTLPNQVVELFSDGTEWKTRVGGLSNTASAWSVTGNAGTTASAAIIGAAVNNNFIGTTDDRAFVIATNNFERMRITGGTAPLGGNIGIGIIAPAARLHLVGTQPVDVATATGTASGSATTITGGTGGTTTISSTGAGGIGGTVTVTGGVGGVANAATTQATGGAGGSLTLGGGAGAVGNVTGGATNRGGAGGATLINTGVGGAASNGTVANVGGASGAFTITGGTGGIATPGAGTGTGGAGGAFSITAGIGGAVSGAATSTSTGGAGGLFNLIAGTGGAATATGGTTNTGGAGGALTVRAGTGGLASGAITTNTGGNGGLLTLAGGLSVAAEGSNGGGVTITGQPSLATGTGGAGGAVSITAGAAAGDNTVNRAGGAVTITAGIAKGATAGGAITLTAAAAGSNLATGTIAGPNGGATQINVGAGGTAPNADVLSTGGAGGLFRVTGGAGGVAAVAGTGGNTGGAGSAVTLNPGAGGAATGITSGTNLGGVGGATTITSGAGGVANTGTGIQTGGASGAVSINLGAGGAVISSDGTVSTGGAGGLFRVLGGAGGASTVAGIATNTGGAGSAITLTPGAGGAATGASSGTGLGGVGGAVTISTGAGGAANTGTGNLTGGASGALSITLGTGGAVTATGLVNTGGAGGALSLTAGRGGDASGGSTSNSGGVGGNLTLSGGRGGTGATAAGTGGSILFNTSTSSAAQVERMRISSNGNVGVGDATPAALFTVGNTDPFQINSTGDMIRIKNVTYSWPTGYGGGNTFLKTDASGVLTWDNPIGTTYSAGTGLTLTGTTFSLTSPVGVTIGGTGTTTQFTPGSVIFAGTGGVYTEDNPNFFWDDAANEFGIGTSNPSARLEIEGPSANWTEATPGLTNGALHLDPGVATDHFGSAITWGASDASNGDNAQAGIYVRSDGSYGTKMYLATTDAYVTGSKTRLFIDSDGNIGIGTTVPSAKLNIAGSAIINSQSGTMNRKIFTENRSIGATAGDFVNVGSIVSNGEGTYIRITESHHFCGTINSAIYEFSDNYYSGATTGWMQVPTQNFRGHNGVQDFAIDVRRTANHGTANLEIRYRNLSGACGAGNTNIEIQTSGTFIASSTSGSGATVAGYLSTNAYQFPVSNDRFKASNEGIFIVNSGNVGIGTTTPVAKLEVAGQVKITGGSPGAGKVLTSDATGLATWTTPSGTPTRTVFPASADYVFYDDPYITFRWQLSGDDLQLAAKTGHTGYWDYSYWGETHHNIIPNSGDHGSDDLNLTTAWADFNGTDLFNDGGSEYGGAVTIFISKEDANTYPTYKLEIQRHGTYVTSIVTVYY